MVYVFRFQTFFQRDKNGQDKKRIQIVGEAIIPRHRKSYEFITTYLNALIQFDDPTLKIGPESTMISKPDCPVLSYRFRR